MKRIIFSLLLALWVVLAVFSLFYNAKKALTEETQWIGLSDTEKRYEIFGDISPFLQFVRDNTQQDATMLIYSQNIMTQYLGMYTLYPRRIEVTDNPDTFKQLLYNNKYDYVVWYNAYFLIFTHEQVATYKAAETSDIGFLLKRTKMK